MTKSKKLIVGGLIGMLGIVGATTATSGVAWFTTTRTAAVSIDNFMATAAEGNLQIADGTLVTEVGLTQTINSNANSSTINATAELTDVSSINGVNFFKATTVNGVTTTKQETAITNSINNTLYNYYEWDIKVTNTSETAPMDVYISCPANDHFIFTDVVAESPDNITPQNWYRLCVFAGGTNNLVYAYGQEATDANKNAGIESVSNGVGTNGTFTHASTCNNITADPETASVAVDNQLLIKNLAGGSANAQTLIFRVWCEGLLTPPDGTDLEVNGNFNLIGFNHANS